MSASSTQEELLSCVPNTMDPKRREACLQWVAKSGFDRNGSARKAIKNNLRWFCQNEPPHDIYTAVGELFTVANGMVEWWPRIVGALFG